MNTVTTLQVTRNKNALSVVLLQEVDQYIDFLNYKYSDAAKQMSDDQIRLIKKGSIDI